MRYLEMPKQMMTPNQIAEHHTEQLIGTSA